MRWVNAKLEKYDSSNALWKRYYSLGGQTVMKDASGFSYFLSDHLGSTAVVIKPNGTIEQQRYLPFGGARTVGTSPVISSTDFTHTGQRDLPKTELMDYNARFYSPSLGRFIQPDSIIPDPANPQAFNRYSYVINNPVRYTDPTGHAWDDCKNIDDDAKCKIRMRHVSKVKARWAAEAKWREAQAAKARAAWVAQAQFQATAAQYMMQSAAFSSPAYRISLGGDGGAFFSGNLTLSGGGTGPAPFIIGPRTVTDPPVTTQEPSAVKFWTEAYKWIGWLEKAALYMDNYGVPAYRHAKGVIPGGVFVEFGLGVLTTGISDFNNPEFTLGQRIVRPIVVGAENAVIDLGATAVATWLAGGAGVVSLGTGPGAAAIAGTVFFGASYGVSRAGDAIAGCLNRRFLPYFFPE